MNLETKITIYKFTPQVFTLTRFLYTHKHISKQTYLFNYPTVQKKLHCVERINKQGILLMYDTQKYFRNLPNTIFISTFEF